MARQRKLPHGMWERNGVYYARFTANGRYVRKRLSSVYQTACELLNDLKARADRADFGLTDNDYPYKDLKREFLQWAKQAVRDSKKYESDLKKLEAYSTVRSIRQIDARYLMGFREWRLGQNVTPRTINRQVGTLCNMLNKGVEWARIGENPIKGIKPLLHDKPKKQRRSLSLAEVELLFQETPAYLLPVWRLFATTGIRKGELVNMRFSDVDYERKTMTVQAETAKNKKAREIPLDDEMLAIIKQLEEEAPSRQPVARKTKEGRLSVDHVFVTGANTPWKNNLLRAFYAICKVCKIEGAETGGTVDLHSLRVTFTTLSIGHGASPKAVQEILGHSTLALTMGIYAKATDKAKRAAVGALPFAKTSNPEHIISMQAVRTERKTEVKEDCSQQLSASS